MHAQYMHCDLEIKYHTHEITTIEQFLSLCLPHIYTEYCFKAAYVHRMFKDILWGLCVNNINTECFENTVYAPVIIMLRFHKIFVMDENCVKLN